MSEYSLTDPNQGIFGSNEPAFDPSLFQIDKEKGLVNLTKIANHFDKRVAKWKELPSTQRFLQAFFEKNPESENWTVVNGGSQNGTWASKKIALKFAEWISVDFEIFANQVLDDYFSKPKLNQPTLPDNYISALEQLLESKKEEQRLRLEAEANKDKVEFADQLLDTTNAIDFKTAAKAMHLDFGRNTLFAKCRELGLIDRNNQPYQEFIDKGYFVLMETSYLHPKTGDRILTTKTLVTAKGQQFLLKKLGK
jgi:phage antirepressor YoqD-like protein